MSEITATNNVVGSDAVVSDAGMQVSDWIFIEIRELQFGFINSQVRRLPFGRWQKRVRV